MDDPLKALAQSGIEAYESSFTALDAYLGLRPAPIRFALACCALQELAAAFDGLRYPGTHYADAALDLGGPDSLADEGGAGILYLRCADSPWAMERPAFDQLGLLRDPRRKKHFLDPLGARPSLRPASRAESGGGEPTRPRALPRAAPPEQLLFEAAVLASRYDYDLPEDLSLPVPRDLDLDSQRDMLVLMLTGQAPERGLGLLERSGFVGAYWPELASLAGIDQAKEFHPEGDAWAHTLETFRHRKLPALGLSLALLLHDAGKPRSEEVEGRRFDRHAEIGRSVAERFLRRLGFPKRLVDDVSFLVRYHMMPAALPRLPANRLEGVIDDPRFPVLLELYKCDELSTFKGPDAYFEACAAYRAWLKNARNPWRSADGKKLARMYLEPAPRGGPTPRRR